MKQWFEDAMSGEDARDVIAEKYPNRKVIAVQCSGSNEPGQKAVFIEVL